MGPETPLKVSLVRCAPIVGLLWRDPIKNYTTLQLVPISVLHMQKVSPSVLFKGYYVLAKRAYTSIFLEQWEALDVESFFQPRFGVAGMKYGCFIGCVLLLFKNLTTKITYCWLPCLHLSLPHPSGPSNSPMELESCPPPPPPWCPTLMVEPSSHAQVLSSKGKRLKASNIVDLMELQ
jgi:hypothetical protein